MFNKAVLLLACTALAGCMNYSKITSAPQEVHYTSKNATEARVKTQTVELRTVQPKPGSKTAKTEILGATCALKASPFRAEVTTPARLILPTYRAVGQPIEVTCHQNGQQTTKHIKPVNLTLQRLNQSTPVGGGLAGALAASMVKGVIKGARNKQRDEFGYPLTIEVEFPARVPAE